MKLKMSLILAISAINSCQTLPDPDIVRHAMCEQLKILSYSKDDTTETAIAITNHNLTLEALCQKN